MKNKICPKCKIRHNRLRSKYCSTDCYEHSKERADFRKKFDKTEKGKLRFKKYSLSEKGINYRHTYRKTSKHFKEWNSKYQPEYLKTYKKEHEKELKEKSKAYTSTEEYKKHRREYLKEYMNDPLNRLKNNIRNLIRLSFKAKGFRKDTMTEKILGCTYSKFMKYIEKQFTSKMNWKNHGMVWHIDHYVPHKIGINKDEVIKLNYYKNLRPLTRKENEEKKDKLPFDYKERLLELGITRMVTV